MKKPTFIPIYVYNTQYLPTKLEHIYKKHGWHVCFHDCSYTQSIEILWPKFHSHHGFKLVNFMIVYVNILYSICWRFIHSTVYVTKYTICFVMWQEHKIFTLFCKYRLYWIEKMYSSCSYSILNIILIIIYSLKSV